MILENLRKEIVKQKWLTIFPLLMMILRVYVVVAHHSTAYGTMIVKAVMMLLILLDLIVHIVLYSKLYKSLAEKLSENRINESIAYEKLFELKKKMRIFEFALLIIAVIT